MANLSKEDREFLDASISAKSEVALRKIMRKLSPPPPAPKPGKDSYMERVDYCLKGVQVKNMIPLYRKRLLDIIKSSDNVEDFCTNLTSMIDDIEKLEVDIDPTSTEAFFHIQTKYSIFKVLDCACEVPPDFEVEENEDVGDGNGRK